MNTKQASREARKFAAYTYPLMVKENSWNRGRWPVIIATFAKYILFRWLFCFIFAIMPALIFQAVRPGLAGRHEVLIVFMWFFMITLRESYVFTRILDLGKYDKTLQRSFNISHGDAFLGRFKIRSITEFIYHFVILIIFGVSVYHAIFLCILTMYFRWAGEKKELKRYQKYEKIDFERRRKQMNIMRIVCALAAYVFPIAAGVMPDGWFWLIHPVVIGLLTPKALLDLRYLYKYKNYEYIVREIIANEKVDKGFFVK